MCMGWNLSFSLDICIIKYVKMYFPDKDRSHHILFYSTHFDVGYTFNIPMYRTNNCLKPRFTAASVTFLYQYFTQLRTLTFLYHEMA